MNKLCDIPNLEGFKFVGIDKDGIQFPCIVKKGDDGCYGAYYLNGIHCYPRLVGWNDMPNCDILARDDYGKTKSFYSITEKGELVMDKIFGEIDGNAIAEDVDRLMKRFKQEGLVVL